MNTEINYAEVTDVEEATRILTEAISEHGQPVYVSKVPVRIQNLVPLEVRKALLADARISEGWVYENGSYYKGRPDMRTAVLTWAKENVFQIVSVKDIADATGASQNIVRELISNRPDIFRKSEGRTYEVRDPQADRKAGKNENVHKV